MKSKSTLRFRTTTWFPLALIGLLTAGGQAGVAETYVFKPADDPNREPADRYFSNPDKDMQRDLPVNLASISQSTNNGCVQTLTFANEGSIVAQSWLEARFPLYVPSTVVVTARVRYFSATLGYFAPLAKNETDFFIWGDNTMAGGGDPERIDACVDWKNFLIDFLSIVGMATSGLEGLGQAGLLLKFFDLLFEVTGAYAEIVSYTFLVNDYLKDAPTRTFTRTFTYNGAASEHSVRVGAQSVSATISLFFMPGGQNFALAMLLGQVDQVTVTVNPNRDQLADMVIDRITITNALPIRPKVPVGMFLVRQNRGNLQTSQDSYAIEVSNNNGQSWTSITWEDDHQDFPAHSAKTNFATYAFLASGSYLLRATADCRGKVDETDETNNTYTTSIYIGGAKPDPPSAPLAYTPEGVQTSVLHRNRQYLLKTSGTDRENDPLSFGFSYSAPGTPDWLHFMRDGSNTCVVIPVVSGLGLGPPDSLGFDSANYWTPLSEHSLLRAQAVDWDGLSEPSAASAVSIVYNTLPDTPTITGDTMSSTIRPFTVIASSSDLNSDQMLFRFDWGEDTNQVHWTTNWDLCLSRQTSRTNSHLYTRPGYYWIHVQATDLYADYEAQKYGKPVECSGVASYLAYIYPYRPGPTSVVVMTKDFERDVPLPNVGFTLSSATTSLRTNTDASSYFAASMLPGDYTVEFADVRGFTTPATQTTNLTTNGHFEVCGEYHHRTNTLRVLCNTAGNGVVYGGNGQVYGLGSAFGASFAFSGTNWSTTAWEGEYQIRFLPATDVDHFDLPLAQGETKLMEGVPAEFCGQYIQRPVACLSLSYPTNDYIPSNSFVLVGDVGVAFDASASYSPYPQPSPWGSCPDPSRLTINSYWLHYGDGWWCWEATNYAGPGTWTSPDGKFDGKNVHRFHAAGQIPVTLIVADSAGVSNRILVQTNVWVKQRPVAHIGISPPAFSIAGETVTFTGSGADADAGDLILTYEWSIDSGPPLTAQSFSTNGLAPGLHSIRLRVRANDNVWSEYASASLEIANPKAWPIFELDPCRLSDQDTYDDRPHGELPYGRAGGLWPRMADSPVEGSPVAANLDTNWANGLEVVFVSRSGNLFVTDNGGTNRWMKNIGRSSSTPAIGDINGDGLPEIVVGSTNGAYAFDPNGTNLYLYPSNSFIFSMPVIADIDPRVPGLEVAVTADDGSVHLIYTNGTAGTNHWPFTYAGAPYPSPPDNPNNVYFTSAPAVADIDPDFPGLEVVVGGADGNLYVLDSTGLNIRSWSIGTNLPIRTTPAIAELCPQVPGWEIVFGADDGVLYCLNYDGISKTLSKLWQWADIAPIRSSPAVCPLGAYNTANAAQVAFGCDAGEVHVLASTNGQHLLAFPCPGTNVMVRSSPAIADIDTVHNGMPEVIFGTSDGTLYVLSFAGTSPTVVYSNVVGSPIFSSPAVADIDHNPDLEILIGAMGGMDYRRLFVFRAIPDLDHLPVPAFTASPLAGGWPLAVAFTDQSSNGPTVWQWDFGDGNTSPEQNPTNTYLIPGTNSVTLTVANANGSATLTETNYIIVYPVPASDFTATPLAGSVPLTVEFTDTSLYGPTSWSWDFGDGRTSSLCNPTNTYPGPGVYPVTLTAGNTYGTNVALKTNYIAVFAVRPQAAFAADPTSGWEPLTVQFTDQSTHSPTAWDWNFGDGTSSSVQHPLHTYQTAGRYLVSLTAANAAGSHTAVSADYIMVTPVVLSDLPPMLVLHFDEATGTIVYDATTNHNDGTIYGAAWTTGRSNAALYFHGSSGDYVVVPHSASLDITNTFWVEAWIKTAGTANYLGIVDKFSGTYNGNGFTLYVNDARLRLSIYAGAKGPCDLWAGLSDPRDNQWHHVAASWDGSYARGYVDGAKLAEVPWTNAPGSTTQPLCIGKRYTGYGTPMPFLGAIDEVRISRAPPLPGPVSASRVGTNVVISWLGFGTLEAATDVTGPYETVTNATCPFTVAPAAAQRFYRLSGP
jgi:PKD repeat protein